jgi:hypothetical protein
MKSHNSNFLENQYLFELNVTKYINKEYIPLIEDIIRMTILQFVIQFMFYIKNPEENSLISQYFIEIVLYIILGVCVYWLLFKKLILLI